MPKSEFHQIFSLSRTLGHGAFATVKMAKRISDNSIWACKLIKKSNLKSGEDEENLINEISIMQSVSHVNIISLEGVWNSETHVYLVMELMRGGELFERIIKKEHYSEQEASTALTQILSAIEHCHSIGIIHRDLKPENLLYQTEHEDSLLKLADFGLAEITRPNEVLYSACGSPGYVAPEILDAKSNNTGYGKEVDIWSIGVIMFILLCGYPPFSSENVEKVYELIRTGSYQFEEPYWTNVSDYAKDLISKMLVVNPLKRLTATECLAHPWIVHNGNVDDLEKRERKILKHMIPNMRKFNARRRLKSAILAVQMINHMKKCMAIHSKEKNSMTSVVVDLPQVVTGTIDTEDEKEINITPNKSIDNFLTCQDEAIVGSKIDIDNRVNSITNDKYTASTIGLDADIAGMALYRTSSINSNMDNKFTGEVDV